MRKITVPILTEEYKVVVLLGEKKDLIKPIARYGGLTEEQAKEDFIGCGICFNFFSKNCHPLIAVDTSLKVEIGLATLAHEASHAMNYIEDYLNLRDSGGEFHAHGIASVVRHCLKHLKKLSK